MKKRIRAGDIVGRKSYGKDILFRVISIDLESGTAILKGIDWRLLADAPIDDLEVVEDEEAERLRLPFFQREQELYRLISDHRRLTQLDRGTEQTDNRFITHPGKVFHLDGDSSYLQICLKQYEKLGIPAVGVRMDEKQMPSKVVALLEEYQPDILVITGHDSYRAGSGGDKHDLKNYRHSVYFIEAVKKVRSSYERHRDNLIIFAGACQSYFEGIMKSGANFASSPERVNIHALDPVYVVEKVAFTSIRETIPLLDVIANTTKGNSGIGGIESRGTFRLGMPKKK